MELNVKEWKEFQIGKMFEIYPTKDYKGMSNTDLDDGGNTPVIANSAVNNGINGFSTLQPTEKGNIITFSDTTEGNTFFYQPDDFIGFAHVQGMHPIGHKWSEKQLLFLATVLTFTNCNLFNYGRKMRRDTISNSKVKLPAQKNGNNYIIDEKKTFSDDGYIPDWEFMDIFIKSLNYKPPKTKIDGKSILDLNIENGKNSVWAIFFDIKKGKRLTSEDQTDGETPYIGAIDSNNGVANYIGQKAIHDGNTISLSYNGSVGEAFYQPKPFWATDDVNVLYFRPQNNIIFNKYIALFFCAVLRQEKYRYSYGRKWVLESMRTTTIKLPANDGKPDYAFMERYMRALPYGDRI